MTLDTKVDTAQDAAAERTATAADAPENAALATSDEAPEVEVDEDDLDESEDSLTYSNGVIEKIVAMATREVPHVLGMKGNLMHFVQEQFGAENLTKGVSVEVTDDNRVIVNIKARVTERLAAMTGLEVAGINLRIEDVVTPEEYEAHTGGAQE